MKNNEPAFPVNKKDSLVFRGMTLRDWFAGQAMAALAGIDPRESPQLSNPNGRQYSDWIAADAYTIADAMLAARKQEAPNGK